MLINKRIFSAGSRKAQTNSYLVDEVRFFMRLLKNGRNSYTLSA